jgi:hypothetical protein
MKASWAQDESQLTHVDAWMVCRRLLVRYIDSGD